jgi:AraC family transcriptional regulator
MELQIEAEIITPRLRVDLRTCRSPMAEEICHKSAGYGVGRFLSSQQGLQRRAEETRNSTPTGPLGIFPDDYPLSFYSPKGQRQAVVCTYERDFFENATGIARSNWGNHINEILSIDSWRIDGIIRTIHSELVRPGFASELMIESAGCTMLVELARYVRRLTGKDRAKSKNRGLASWQLRRIQERVKDLLEMGSPTLRELAKLCGTSQNRLMYNFKASCGITVHKYIEEERLTLAKDLLMQGHLSTKEIADRLGFCSPAYFSAAFRRLTGMTPSEFRSP